MRVFAYMVTKNEADRYLFAAAATLAWQVDGLFVYDDQSTDRTLQILNELRIPYAVRRDEDPSFQEDESAFRHHAWDQMDALFAPRLGDWIVSLDADELLRCRGKHIKDVVESAQQHGYDALWLRVHEMWAEGQVRVDGFWGDIKALRMCAWKPEAEFVSKKMGGGSLPGDLQQIGWCPNADILHFGYYDPADREPKMVGYLTNPAHGHNPKHIRSIILPPTLADLSDL